MVMATLLLLLLLLMEKERLLVVGRPSWADVAVSGPWWKITSVRLRTC